MRFPNETLCRKKSPNQFDAFRRQSNADGAGVHFIFGIKTGPPRKAEIQAILSEPKPVKREIEHIATPTKREIEVVETPSERVIEKIAQEKLDIKRGMI